MSGPGYSAFPWNVPALVRRTEALGAARVPCPCGGVLVKGVLRPAEQRALYEMLAAHAAGSPQHDHLRRVEADRSLAGDRPLAFAMWQHPCVERTVPRPRATTNSATSVTATTTSAPTN